MDHSTLMKSNYANIWELPKNNLTSKNTNHKFIYIDLIDSTLNNYALPCYYFVFTYFQIEFCKYRVGSLMYFLPTLVLAKLIYRV